MDKPEQIEAVARHICEVKGYDPDYPAGENRVQWETFIELAKATLDRWQGRTPSITGGDTELIEAVARAIFDKQGWDGPEGIGGPKLTWEQALVRPHYAVRECREYAEVAIEAITGEDTELIEAAQALIDDVRRRYPGEELRCEYMRALDQALTGKQS